MDLQNEKCVMVIDENLPTGIIANTAAILGIVELPVPILKGNPDLIREIREKLYQPDFEDLTVVDFTDLAQSCKTYGEFMGKMAQVSGDELNYFGLAICGSKKKVNKLTGSMPLLR